MGRRRALGLVELVVAMAVLAILAAAGTASYTAFVRAARTSVAAETLDQLGTLLETYRSFAPSEGYPTDAVNRAGLTSSGKRSYDALVTDSRPTRLSPSRPIPPCSRPGPPSRERPRPLRGRAARASMCAWPSARTAR